MHNSSIDKFVNYLNKYKSNYEYPIQNNWNKKIDKLDEILTETEKKDLKEENKQIEKEILLKKILNEKLSKYNNSDNEKFIKTCLWIIQDWGGITNSNIEKTKELINKFLKNKNLSFERIASISKVASFLNPQENIIYDSRVAYTINWIILNENLERRFFPIPEGRNSKMAAFDLNVLIRLKNVSNYHNFSELNNKFYINNLDKKIFFNKNEAYLELNKLIKQINPILWKGDSEKEKNLYYTEMLLFSIADNQIFKEIVEKHISLVPLPPHD